MLARIPKQWVYKSLRRYGVHSGRRDTALLNTGNLMPFAQRLNSQQLLRQKADNDRRIGRVIKTLSLEKYDINLGDKSEVHKCLYPTKLSTVRLNDQKAYSNKILEELGKDLLRLTVNELFLSLFKRTSQDIKDYDFNFALKMKDMSSWKRSPTLLVRNYLKRNGLSKIARLPIPEGKVPMRIQYAYDQRSFDAIIGCISVLNEQHIVLNFLRNSIGRDLLKSALAR